MPAFTFNECIEKSISESGKKAILFVGLKISGAKGLAIKGGEDPDDFHVTLAYGHFSGWQHDESSVDSIVKRAIDEVRNAIPDTIRFDAIGRFKASDSSDGKDVIYARVAAGQLEEAHDSLLASLKKNGLALTPTFPEYKPHMTLAYIDPNEKYELTDIDVSGTTTQVMIGYGQDSSHETNYTIVKSDDDKRLVFGWASVSINVDGEQIQDRQEDIIDPEELEAAAYEYVLNFRDTGEEHISTLRKKGKLVESCVFTAEKQKAMGIPEGILPIGWWIGFKIEDDAAWEKVKNGTYKMFSIEGKAYREPVEKAQRNYDEFPSFDMWLEENLDATIEEQREAEAYYKKQKSVAKTFDEVLKFNPYHDAKGRFASANAASSFTYAPGKSKAHDKAIQREKDSDADAGGTTYKLYHGSPKKDIESLDIAHAGKNTSSGEKLIYLTDSREFAEEFSYERLEGSSKFTNRKGQKGRVYEVEATMKHPLDLRNLSDDDVQNVLRLDADGLLTADQVKLFSAKNNQLLKAGLDLRSETLQNLGYDGLIANDGRGSVEYAVVSNSQVKITS